MCAGGLWGAAWEETRLEKQGGASLRVTLTPEPWTRSGPPAGDSHPGELRVELRAEKQSSFQCPMVQAPANL